ncbi:MAG: hypothetical protein ABIF71_06820 [Planctomycetota bacterium]
MSYSDGWAALNLEMPPRVPRTEYSVAGHWELIRAVTGIPVTADSPAEVRERAQKAFVGHRGWNYDMNWSILISAGEFGDLRTDMGHAVYDAGGGDFRTTVHCPFTTPEEVLAFDPVAAYGQKDRAVLVKRFEDHYRANRACFPDLVSMTGIYTTVISGLIDIFGWEMLLLAAGTDLAGFGKVADRYARWIQQYFDALAAADVPVVMVHDDIVWTSGPFLPPDWYRAHVFPH